MSTRKQASDDWLGISPVTSYPGVKRAVVCYYVLERWYSQSLRRWWAWRILSGVECRSVELSV